MQFRSTAKLDKQATLILIDEQKCKSKKFSFGREINQSIVSAITAKLFCASSGQLFPLLNKTKLILLVGLGKKSELSSTELRMNVKKALLSSHLSQIKDVEIIPHATDNDSIESIIEAVYIGTYQWKKYKTKDKDDKTIDQKSVTIAAAKKSSFDDTIKICEGVNLARDLINENADVAISTYVESVIKKLIKGKKNVSTEILGEKEMKSKGLNLHLAVNKGSNNPPKLIIVKYTGAGKGKPYTAFIGKGMTYDTGGLNLKPTGHIETMRMDMSGSAAVVGTLKNALDLKLKKNIIFAVGMAENVTDAKAYKPGDVFKSYNGKTVEIGNTDAEGRLVLADAISYIVRNYNPARVVDIATLTGAVIVALGQDYTGLVSNDERFANDMLNSAAQTDDRAWALPSYTELKRSVKSPIADIRNLGFPKGAGGTITAAEFLRQFTDDRPWAHLDIAGTAFVDGDDRLYFSHGATGAGVRLMTHYLSNH